MFLSVVHVNMVHDMKKNWPHRFRLSQILAACAKQETGCRKPLVGFLDKSFKMVRSDAGEDNSKDFCHLVLSLIWDLSLPCS